MGRKEGREGWLLGCRWDVGVLVVVRNDLYEEK